MAVVGIAVATVLTGGAAGVLAGVALASMMAGGTVLATSGASEIIEDNYDVNPIKDGLFGGNEQAMDTYTAMGELAAFCGYTLYEAAPAIEDAFNYTTATIKSNAKGPYAYMDDSNSVGSGKDFTSSQKAKILNANMEKNNGQIISDTAKEVLVAPQKYTKGYTPPKNEAQIDHIYPKSYGGSNSYSNAQVISRAENISKSNKLTYMQKIKALFFNVRQR